MSPVKHVTWICFCLLCSSVWSQTIVRSLSKETWEFKNETAKEWLPATVPGCIHTDLLNLRLIPDPFIKDNEQQLQWIEKQTWEYRSQVQITPEEFSRTHLVLCFKGLDTYATVFLNGQLLLTADNMFRTWEADIKKMAKPGKNELLIRFESAVNKGKQLASQLPYTLPGDEKVFSRKAQYQYGWDWGPRLVTAGIWKDVDLLSWDFLRVENSQFIQEQLSASDASARIEFKIQSDIVATVSLSADVFELNSSSDDSKSFNIQVQLNKGMNTVCLPFHVAHPQLWWCNGMGNPARYALNLKIQRATATVFEDSINVGFRTIELVQQNDSIGRSFYFKLNGIPVYMKGSNVIPMDNFEPRVTEKQEDALIQNAVDAHMNMLRIWGGGIYADDHFYSKCDEKGVLLWQDLMFACAMYPGDADFVKNVQEEVKQQVSRMQAHPCLALICGNNEVEEGWKNWGWQQQYKYSVADSEKIWNDYKSLFYVKIPEAIQTVKAGKAPFAPDYYPSSPSIGWGHKESLTEGDSHYWGVWWGHESFDQYKLKVGRFMSEYGFQGMPSQYCLEKSGCYFRSAGDSTVRVDSTALKNHQKHPIGFETMLEYMRRDYPVSTDPADFIYLSQLLQARGMKIAIESQRSKQPRCMGSLFWQLNDCWPACSWSAIDYYGKKKALYYQAKRSFSPLTVVFDQTRDSTLLTVVSDIGDSILCTALIQCFDLHGQCFSSDTLRNVLVRRGAFPLTSFYQSRLGHAVAQFALSVSLSYSFDSVPTTVDACHFFVAPNELKLQEPHIDIKRLDDTTLRLTSDCVAKDVYISDDSAEWDDNYFDLMPGKSKLIHPAQGTVPKINTLALKTLFDCKK